MLLLFTNIFSNIANNTNRCIYITLIRYRYNYLLLLLFTILPLLLFTILPLLLFAVVSTILIIMPKASFTEAQMDKCLADIAKKDGRSLREVCRNNGINEASVRTRIKRNEKAVAHGDPKIGRPTVISKEDEKELADCIAILCKNGFSPTLDDIRLIVQKYVTDNDLKTPFENDNKPGRRWMDRFLVKNNLSLKR